MTVTNALATAYSNQKKGLGLSTGRQVTVVADTTTEASFRYSDKCVDWSEYGKTRDVLSATSNAVTSYSNQKQSTVLSDGSIVSVITPGSGETLYSFLAKRSSTGEKLPISAYYIDGWLTGSIDAYVDSGGNERLIAVWEQTGAGGGRTSGDMYVMVGTFNAGKNTITWGTAVSLGVNANYKYPDIIVLAEGTGGVAHVVMSLVTATPDTYCMYKKITISSSGVPTAGSLDNIGGSYNGVGRHCFPSIDADPTTKRLHLAISSGTTGAGKGIRYKTASYSGGVWTWASEVDVDTAYYSADATRGFVCRWDGSRVVIGGMINTAATDRVRVYDSTNFTSFTNRIDVAGSSTPLYYFGMAVDPTSGDVLLFGAAATATSINHYRCVRSGSTLTIGSQIILDQTATATSPYPNASVSGTNVALIYTIGSANPYTIKIQVHPLSELVSDARILGWSNGSIAAYVDSGGTERLVAVWKQTGTGGGRTDGNKYMMVGTFNAGRTTLTWGTAQAFSGGASFDYFDVVCHAEGTGGYAHTVGTYNDGAGTNTTAYYSASISSAGVLASPSAVTTIGGSYGVSVYTFPSIDIDLSTKRLHVAWSAGTTGAGKGIRYRTAAYSAGVWTWATEVEVDNTQYVDAGGRWVICRWDGTRVVIGTWCSPSFNFDVWDSTNFTAFTRRINSAIGGGSGQGLYSGSMVINPATGDVYAFGQWYLGGPLGNTHYYKCTRAGTALTIGSIVQTDMWVGSTTWQFIYAWFSAAILRLIYTHGNNSPYQVKYDQIKP